MIAQLVLRDTSSGNIIITKADIDIGDYNIVDLDVIGITDSVVTLADTSNTNSEYAPIVNYSDSSTKDYRFKLVYNEKLQGIVLATMQSDEWAQISDSLVPIPQYMVELFREHGTDVHKRNYKGEDRVYKVVSSDNNRYAEWRSYMIQQSKKLNTEGF